MKKRRPLSENPFFDPKNKRNFKYLENIPHGGFGPEEVTVQERRCKAIKNGKQCENTVPANRYFHCQKCQPTIDSDNGFDSNY